MKQVRTVEELRREVAAARSRAGAAGPGVGDPTIGFVPTMGALHRGHLSLVDRSRSLTRFTVLSIFVNPTQFAPGEDFERYPRNLERDAELAEQQGVELLFAPSVEEMYGTGEPEIRVVPGPMAERLCGLSRPGHFTGVLTVVAKLFATVLPDVAVFGQKDYQQVTLIRRMARELAFPTRVETAPIVREPDGLALSSRNAYLTDAERERALSLSQGLLAARAAFEDGVVDVDRLKARVRGLMRDANVEPEYIELVDGESLDPLEEAGAGAVLAVAARVGETRLIDNVILGQQD